MALQLYEDTTVTGILQPSNTSTEDSDIAFCAALIILTHGQVEVHLINFTGSPYTLKRGRQVANFTVLTPKFKQEVKHTDPVTTWHLMQDDPQNVVSYVSCFMKFTKPEDFSETTGFQHQKTLGTLSITHQPRNDFVRITHPSRTRNTQSTGKS